MNRPQFVVAVGCDLILHAIEKRHASAQELTGSWRLVSANLGQGVKQDIHPGYVFAIGKKTLKITGDKLTLCLRFGKEPQRPVKFAAMTDERRAQNHTILYILERCGD